MKTAQNLGLEESLSIEKKVQAEQQAIIAKSKEVKTALNATYDSWLSESDWENVDLLIYYLDTGRADTLKEALGMVDRQRQTNQIFEAISVASRAIQSTIQSATMRLATAMEESFTLISKQIGAMSKNINRLGNITAEGQRVQNEQNATIAAMGAKLVHLQEEQLSSNEMTQALLEKANVSSEQLLTDLRYNQRLWIKP